MKTQKLDALLIWKQIEDQLVPRLRLNLVERVVYYHLLRHTRLEGRLKLRFSIVWLTRGIRLSAAPARQIRPLPGSLEGIVLFSGLSLGLLVLAALFSYLQLPSPVLL